MVADWVNGKDKTRELVYVDELQAPEVITGKLNPETQIPPLMGGISCRPREGSTP
jgi:hypothetical protein